jgi:hypothetical protein
MVHGTSICRSRRRIAMIWRNRACARWRHVDGTRCFWQQTFLSLHTSTVWTQNFRLSYYQDASRTLPAVLHRSDTSMPSVSHNLWLPSKPGWKCTSLCDLRDMHHCTADLGLSISAASVHLRRECRMCRRGYRIWRANYDEPQPLGLQRLQGSDLLSSPGPVIPRGRHLLDIEAFGYLFRGRKESIATWPVHCNLHLL